MKIFLVNDGGRILAEWSIAHELEFDPDDIEADAKHDFYTVPKWTDPEDVGNEIWQEVLCQKERGMQ